MPTSPSPELYPLPRPPVTVAAPAEAEDEDLDEEDVELLLLLLDLELDEGLELGTECARLGLELGSAPPLASCSLTQSAPPSERTVF